MNIPVLIVACITALALGAHVFVGTRETVAIAPPEGDRKRTGHWVQAMCAFQMLSVDLLLVTVALFAVAIMDFGALERSIILLFGLLYVLWGAAWVVQMQWLKAHGIRLFRLPQWLVWFACAGLLFVGA